MDVFSQKFGVCDGWMLEMGKEKKKKRNRSGIPRLFIIEEPHPERDGGETAIDSPLNYFAHERIPVYFRIWMPQSDTTMRNIRPWWLTLLDE